MKGGLIFAIIAGLLLTGCGRRVQEGPKDSGAPKSIIGVGLMLRQSDGRPLSIMDVVSNTPASQAGLAPGLVIEKIDGTPTAGMNLEQSVDMMRGVEGTTVTLEVIDPKNDTTNSVTLTREKIALRPARHAPAPGP
jgi:carboxyl-terminal processing protease